MRRSSLARWIAGAIVSAGLVVVAAVPARADAVYHSAHIVRREPNIPQAPGPGQQVLFPRDHVSVVRDREPRGRAVL